MKQGMLLAGLLLAANGAWAQGSPYIQEIEQQLQQLGFDPGPVDGRFDSRLTAAINAFKSSRNLPQDGLLDARTRDLLARAVAPQPAQPPVTLVQPAPPPVTVVQPAPPPVVRTAPPAAPAPTPTQTQTPAPTAAAATAPPDESAPTNAPRRAHWNWVGGGFLEFGGDDVVTVTFTNNESQDLKAGQGVGAFGGGLFRPHEESMFELRGTLGFKYVTTAASNADITLTRLVWEVEPRLRFGRGFWATIPAVLHTHIEYSGDGFTSDISFDNAIGTGLRLGWRGLALRWTYLEYSDRSGRGYDASSIGFSASYPF